MQTSLTDLHVLDGQLYSSDFSLPKIISIFCIGHDTLPNQPCLCSDFGTWGLIEMNAERSGTVQTISQMSMQRPLLV